VYERGSGRFSPAALDKLAPGKQISVSLGSGSSFSEVFTGYIDELGMRYDAEAVCLRATCLDARALMREGACDTAARGQSIGDVAGAILGRYSPLISKKTLTLTPWEKDVNLTQSGSDLDYIADAALLRGKYFYIDCGSAYIGDAQSTVCLELDWGQCEMEFGLRHLQRKFVGMGYDYASMETFKAEVEVVGKQSLLSVTKAIQLPRQLLGDAGKDAVTAAADAAKRECITGTITCRGIPQPKLGQKVKINKFPLASLGGDSFTVVSVRHRMNSADGFSTEIGIGG
jgi:hypothetical protein